MDELVFVSSQIETPRSQPNPFFSTYALVFRPGSPPNTAFPVPSNPGSVSESSNNRRDSLQEERHTDDDGEDDDRKQSGRDSREHDSNSTESRPEADEKRTTHAN